MAESSDKLEKLRQNLIDAGCCECLIDECIKCYNEKNKTRLKCMLTKQKLQLLDNLHECQDQIDCLDYLIYELSREN